ncbi:hypothetical protein [Microbacterium aurantiacum]|uniref:hypothetical protein n=1 Tax=Microbacterium aurantiacum TaxID=162393 RepID=UPI004035AEDB
MYRSTDLNGDPVVSTGVVVVPLGPPPAEGRTVVSWGHPTTGSASECAPSLGLDPYIGIEGMRVLLDRGYTVVATDYTGMGTAGPDSYLIVILWGPRREARQSSSPRSAPPNTPRSSTSVRSPPPRRPRI